ncbi:RidA family protein [Pseudohongiella spirulinae]|uniref:Translation initiation inhibitor n=1 Tax=Pseudohongiella spirulinae TaxID=1249552 RepID=A0A0S2KDB3_9GAMM|nr:Rid family detoxifying hydrolase [Pseudohongiella spirulinae]ALO45954.1 Translation initiation inhibitor [Pseudohongiella spirulinae]
MAHKSVNIFFALVCIFLTACHVSPSTGKLIHSTADIYPAVGPYSQIVQAGDQYFLSGVIPLNLNGDAIAGDTIEQQTRQVLDYIAAKLQSLGLRLEHVVMATVYMTDLQEFSRMNQVYGEYFVNNAPARATVEVARLPRDAKIEIAVVASSL